MVIQLSYKNKNKEILYSLLDKYNLNKEEKEEILHIIIPFFDSEKFQIRMSNEFSHHGNVSLGEHIIEVAIVTYLLSKKYKEKHKNTNFNVELAVKIAMLHDLYELPWQNNSLAGVTKFYNKHGFRHPIEAVINANLWYPKIFYNRKDAEIIIDGIIHHMYPLPVTSVNNFSKNLAELKNYINIKNMSLGNMKILINSLNGLRVGNLSFSRSKFKEGRIVSKADKIVSLKNFNRLTDFLALLTGKNKHLKNNKK